MHAIIRADSGTELGFGHISRCLTLAQELSAHGIQITFVCRPHLGAFLAMIKQHGFDCKLLPKPKASSHSGTEDTPEDYQHWLGASQHVDAEQTLEVIKQLPEVDWLVVDHYAIGQSWHQHLRPYVKQILVIDDLANRALDCDLLLDQTPGREASSYNGYLPNDTQRLCGSKFALLRREFLEARATLAKRRTYLPPYTIMVSMGGTDPKNISTRVIKALEQVDETLIRQIQVVIGRPPPRSLHRQPPVADTQHSW